MKLVLTGLEELRFARETADASCKGDRILRMEYCGVCRTDAKMFYQGQRDLVFPRVMGHEVVALDPGTEERFVLWPGMSCGRCDLCRTGREHLCEDIRIMGFHFDGGYARRITAAPETLIPLPPLQNPALGTFAEPMGCLVNIFDNIEDGVDDSLIIYGGGTLGLMAAYRASRLGITPLIIEKDEEKIAAIAAAAELAGAEVVKDTFRSDFAAAINSCADNTALASAMTKVRKGGKLLYFSGVKKNENFDSNLLNLIHYRELKIFGSYGLSRNHMSRAVQFISENEGFFDTLVEGMIGLGELGAVMPRVISGQGLKYIVDGGLSADSSSVKSEDQDAGTPAAEGQPRLPGNGKSGLLELTCDGILPLLPERIRRARAKIDDKAKPLGGFGKIEDLAVKISSVQNSLNPLLRRKMVLVFAADHGLTEEGVSAYPREVTRKMVTTLLKGKGAINVLCQTYGLDHRIIDMGVDHDFDPDVLSHPLFMDRKIRKGSRNMALQPALTSDEAGDGAGTRNGGLFHPSRGGPHRSSRSGGGRNRQHRRRQRDHCRRHGEGCCFGYRPGYRGG